MSGFNPVGSSPVASIGTTNASGVVYSLTAGYAQFNGVGFTVTYVFPPNRVTWIGVEVLHEGNAEVRVTWAGIEVLRSIATAVAADVTILW